MKYYLLYVLALWFLGYTVNKMLDNEYDNAMKTIDEHERIAWSSGFERGVKSVVVSRTT